MLNDGPQILLGNSVLPNPSPRPRYTWQIVIFNSITTFHKDLSREWICNNCFRPFSHKEEETRWHSTTTTRSRLIWVSFQYRNSNNSHTRFFSSFKRFPTVYLEQLVVKVNFLPEKKQSPAIILAFRKRVDRVKESGNKSQIQLLWVDKWQL